MSFESLTNRGEYLSAHYLAEVLPTTLKGGLLKRWAEEEKAGRVTPRAGLRGMRRDYLNAKAELTDLRLLQPEEEAAERDLIDPERLRKLHNDVLRQLGYDAQHQVITVERAGQEHEVQVAHAELGTAHGIVALDCGWAVDTDAAQDPEGPGRLLEPVALGSNETIATGAKLASWLFAAENPPRYVLILSGGVITLADRSVWGEGRYLAVSLDTAYARNDEKELDVIAAVFGADSLRPPAEGGTEPLADMVAGSRQHAVGVSSELREGLRVSVELIANEVLDRIRQEGFRPEQVMELDELAKELGREALRYLYRILFLLYAEARPELGVLPVDDPEYVEGYSLARLGDLISRRLAPSAEGGFHLYESLDLLFRMVNDGHRPRRGEAIEERASESEGLRFEPMKSDLFLPEKTKLIGRKAIPHPDSDPDDPDGPKIDTRLRNVTLYQVLRRLMLTKGGKKQRGGFISYAQLGINQLGAVYEGLMSYTGFVATEQLYEVAKNGDPKDGSWMIPASKADEYDDSVFVYKENPYTGVRSRVTYAPGQFVYRLAGRDRQTSASYYTPQSLTEVTVQLALKYRLDQDGTVTKARELLDWTICEPALGSGAFLNEAINQVAAEYLRRRQEETGKSLDPEQYHVELQKVKAYIGLHNCYGVDLNRTAVELAEVSLWLNVMHAGLQAPWFGLHLQRGNSLIGGGRKLYSPKQLADKSWLTTAPQEKPFRDGPIDEGMIHQFLLPADGWGAVAGEKEARELAPAETERLKKWRTAVKRVPTAKGKSSQVKRLQGLARRVEFLWDLVQRRLAISEGEIRRHIPVWGADDLPSANGVVHRDKIVRDLTLAGTPFWRLKTVMDVWCALWFWSVDNVGLLDGSARIYGGGTIQVSREIETPVYDQPPTYVKQDIFGYAEPQQLALPSQPTRTRRQTLIERTRAQVPLADLDDWLAFLEALVGRADIPADSLVANITTLNELSEVEARLEGLMGMENPLRLSDRFPWLDEAVRVADQQGFFHWELNFGQVFSRGGFDLQIGNPPWVRPDWREDDVLAEGEPWFRLSDKPSPEARQQRRLSELSRPSVLDHYLSELTNNAGLVATLGHPATFSLLSGTRPDLYRAFMCQVWRHIGVGGLGGLVHPDTHFGGTKEGRLRAAAYKHLRFHARFSNRLGIFEDVAGTRQFGIHIYGDAGLINFTHLSWLFSPLTLIQSLEHDGSGDIPGQKYQGKWDVRPHRARVVRVDESLLAEWRSLQGEQEASVEETSLLYPITTYEQQAISALSAVPRKLGSREPHISFGYDEGKSKSTGILQVSPGLPPSLDEVVLQGPHFGIATPFAKQPNDPYRGSKDWRPWDGAIMPTSVVPRTLLSRACDRAAFLKLQDSWSGRRYTTYYRLAWRAMVAFDTERSLFPAIIPPGPTHVHAVHSMAMPTTIETAMAAGLWASLVFDYALRVSGKSNHGATEAKALPWVDHSHPLAQPLLLRALRLNCQTDAYSNLWSEVFQPEWVNDRWAISWPDVNQLGLVRRQWDRTTPLRTEKERRAALVEIDSLVAVMLGIAQEELLAILRSRYPILSDYELNMWFDASGRRIALVHHAYGVGQTKEHYEQLMAHLDDPERKPVPEGYTAPFYKADRENEYRQAHAVFSKRLQDAIDAGWQAS
ncbi:class I SAM-dependent DNA methyltransferase [Micromonospora sediminicola]|uniref:class I SAM-dependent DNA methyltransferase n=1 Tax=Micromonospora sediminicola TaxID=946078 RepID=UPI0033C378FF